ncbi:MAG: hypothetical protein IK065_05175 [Neisseriaceae bacterium]|nr:hypothetical protein [Neisseriaceae bacterium]
MGQEARPTAFLFQKLGFAGVSFCATTTLKSSHISQFYRSFYLLNTLPENKKPR